MKTNLILITVTVVALTWGCDIQAQYTLDWSTTAGGGGTISGRDYTLDGTVGQPDAGHLAGGDYTLEGGFWSAFDDEALPRLAIRRQGNQVILSWPDPSTGFQLQETTTLASGASWANVTATPVVVGANKEVSLTILAGSRAFRLRRP